MQQELPGSVQVGGEHAHPLLAVLVEAEPVEALRGVPLPGLKGGAGVPFLVAHSDERQRPEAVPALVTLVGVLIAMVIEGLVLDCFGLLLGVPRLAFEKKPWSPINTSASGLSKLVFP